MFSINSSPIMLLSFYKQDGCCITCILHIATCSNISVWYTKMRGLYFTSILYKRTLQKRQGAAGEYPETPCVVI